MYYCGTLHTDEQRLDDQLEPIYCNFMPIRDVASRTSWERWTIETGDKSGSGRSMLAAWHDDDDDDDGIIHIYIQIGLLSKYVSYTYMCTCMRD